MRIRRIGVFTSGGDAPGMNAAIRAIVRAAIYNGLEVVGIMRGFAGMIKGEMFEMNLSSVSNIIQKGGTILKTSRCEEFRTSEGRRKAAISLSEWSVDVLVAIGGDGTYRGVSELSREWGVPAVGIPGTIDNDIYGTDYTIGYDTAVNTALDAIDKIRDTAASHERIFFVEVMGRESGFIALEVGLAGGAEAILIPEVDVDIDKMCETLMKGRSRGKTSSIVVVAEGYKAGRAFEVAEKVKERTGMEYRVVVLGHIQRGGTPTVRDRILASRLGAAAVEAILEGRFNVMIGEVKGEIKLTPLEMIWTHKKEIDLDLYKLAGILSI